MGGFQMPRITKKIIDENENMEPIISKKSGNFVVWALITLAIIVIVYISLGIIKRERERKRIDEIVTSIQNEIYLKQCHLDKMYCCGYKDKEACEKWKNANCSEEDGSNEINCNIKF